MPLAFESISHGTIAFGFFNIESDMLICDRWFLYADKFCGYITDMAKHAGEPFYASTWQVHEIEEAEKIGDLMGAIHGVRHTGFIGELYRHFPFPEQPEDFRQNPEGDQTQSLVSEIILEYARKTELDVAVNGENLNVTIGSYRFDRSQFQELLKYVWQGGYPRWKNDVKPGYVLEMRKHILSNRKGIFEGIGFPD